MGKKKITRRRAIDYAKAITNKNNSMTEMFTQALAALNGVNEIAADAVVVMEVGSSVLEQGARERFQLLFDRTKGYADSYKQMKEMTG